MYQLKYIACEKIVVGRINLKVKFGTAINI